MINSLLIFGIGMVIGAIMMMVFVVLLYEFSQRKRKLASKDKRRLM